MIKQLTIFACILCALFLSGCAQPVEEQQFVYQPDPAEQDRLERELRDAKNKMEQMRRAEEEKRRQAKIAAEIRKKRVAEIREKRLEAERERQRIVEEERRKHQILLLQRAQKQEEQVRLTIDSIKTFIEQGECNRADRLTHQLLDYSSSDDGTLEIDLTTSVCLCHLKEKGDMHRFNQCGTTLRELTKHQSFLEEATGATLTIVHQLGKQPVDTDRDLRVSKAISDGIKRIHTNKEN